MERGKAIEPGVGCERELHRAAFGEGSRHSGYLDSVARLQLQHVRHVFAPVAVNGGERAPPRERLRSLELAHAFPLDPAGLSVLAPAVECPRPRSDGQQKPLGSGPVSL